MNTEVLLWSFEGVRLDARTISAVIAAGRHLFPFRTEQLSPPAPMVLGGQPPGRVGRRRSLHGGAARAALLYDPVAELRDDAIGLRPDRASDAPRRVACNGVETGFSNLRPRGRKRGFSASEGDRGPTVPPISSPGGLEAGRSPRAVSRTSGSGLPARRERAGFVFQAGGRATSPSGRHGRAPHLHARTI